jgi:thymidylate synthase
MITTINGTTADDVWQQAAKRFVKNDDADAQASRAGRTYEIMHAGLSLSDPTQRWVLSRQPAINPAFALAEVIWIVNGRNDSDFLNFWNPNLPDFAGYGEQYHGAYGHRLRHQFGVDQLMRAFHALKNNPDSRQVVLQIYHPESDLPKEDGSPAAADIPCNVTAMLKIRDGALEWTQVLRSNDLFLGVPYNFVQFTHLQEILAGWLDVEVGSYNHFADSLHVYEKHLGNATRTVEAFDASELPRNTDSLRFSLNESTRYFTELAERVGAFIEGGNVRRAASWDGAPESIQNILRILGAEAARRHEALEHIKEIAASCTNPALSYIWQQWMKRFDAEAKPA